MACCICLWYDVKKMILHNLKLFLHNPFSLLVLDIQWQHEGFSYIFLMTLPFIIHRCYMSKYFELLSPSWVHFLVKSNGTTFNLIIDMFGFNSTKIVFSICLSALSYSVHLFLTSLEWSDIFSIPFYLLRWLFSHVSLCYLFCAFPYAFLIYQVYLQK